MKSEKNNRILKIALCTFIVMIAVLLCRNNAAMVEAASVAKAKIVTIEAKDAESQKITWEKVTGAKGYELYQATSKKGKYKKVKDITNGKTISCTISGLKTGSTYYYKVKAYTKSGTKKVYGKESAIKSAKAVPATPKLTKISLKGENTITITWEKVKKSDGYIVYRKVNNGKWKKLTTISGNANITYTDEKLDKGTEYAYTVCAYKKVKKTNVAGAYDKEGLKKSTAITVSASSKPYANRYTKSKNYNSDTKTYYMLNSYMEYLDEMGGGVLILKKGVYNVPSTIYVPSNVTIILKDGVVLNKTDSVGKANITASNKLFMFVTRELKDKKNSVKGYKGIHDVTVKAEGTATINMGTSNGVVFAMAHNDDIKISNITIKLNAKDGKAFSLSGCSDVSIENCTVSSKKNDGRAILIDLPASATTQTYTWSKSDDTVCKNIKISKCNFKNLGNAIYSNRFMKEKYHSKVAITACTFNAIKEDAIRMLNWSSPSVKDCKFTNIGAGAVSGQKNLFVGIRVYGVQTPVIKGNNFDNVERTIFIGYKENSDSKLKKQGTTKNNIETAVVKAMVTENKIGKLGDYYISRIDSAKESENKKYWFPDSTTSYTMTANQSPYRNQFVNAEDYSATTKQYYVFRSYLEQMERNGGGTLEIKAGTYKITGKLYIPSNVKIKLSDGVNIICAFPSTLEGPLMTMVNQTDLDKEKTYTAYNGVHDVTIEGPASGTAVIDKNYIAGSTITIAHTSNVTVRNITFKNMNASLGHFIELDASQNTLIENNTFTGYKTTKGIAAKEAINIDLPDKNTGGFNAVYTSYDCTPNKNVTIQKNVFKNLMAAVGSHMYTNDKMHTNIKILNNQMKDCDYYAIRAMNWDTPIIQNNTISGIGNRDDGEAILLQGVKNPTISNNTVGDAQYFMKIMTAKYNEESLDKSNPNYKKLLAYKEVVNNFKYEDCERLGFYNNTLQDTLKNHCIKYKNKDSASYAYWDMEQSSEFVITTASAPYMNSVDVEKTDSTYWYEVFKSYLEQLEKIGGGKITVKAGTYTISNTLFIPSNTTIELENGAVLKKGTATKRLMVILDPAQKELEGTLSAYGGAKNVTITGSGTIDLGGVADMKAIDCPQSSNVTLDGITFTGGNAITYLRLYSANDVKVKNCKFVGNANENCGITVVAAFGNVPCKSVTVDGCSFDKLKYSICTTKKDSISGVYQENITITNSIFTNGSGHYVQAYGWKNIAFKNNQLTGLGTDGIYGINIVGSQNGLAVTDNIFTNFAVAVKVGTDVEKWPSNGVTEEEYTVIRNQNTYNSVTEQVAGQGAQLQNTGNAGMEDEQTDENTMIGDEN